MKKLFFLLILLSTSLFSQDRPAPRPLYYDGTYWSWWRIGSTPAVPDSGIRLSIEDEPILDRKVLSIKSGAIGIPDTTYLDLVLRNLYFYSSGKFSKVADTLKTQSGKIIEHSTLIAQNADDIIFEAMERQNKDTTLEASIKINAKNIVMKVSKDSVVNSINLSGEGAKINANKIELDGKTVFKAISNGQDSTVIDGGYLKSGTVAADTVRSTVFYNKMFIGGTIKGGSLYSRNWTGGGTIGSFFDLDNGYFILGGSSNPKLSWDGTDLNIKGNINGGSINLGNGKFQVSSSGDLTASSAALSGSFSSAGTNGSINIQDGVITGTYPFSAITMGNGGLTLSYGGHDVGLNAMDGPTSLGDGYLYINTPGGGVEIDGSKALTSSNSVIGDITGLQAALNSKASASHLHAINGEGAPVGSPGDAMTYYDYVNDKCYINCGGSWRQIAVQ